MAERRASIQAVILFGSRARDKYRADRWSDVDLQVVTSRPALFYNQDWTRIFGDDAIWAYAVRAASGGVRKATVAFRSGAEIDFVVVPSGKLRELRTAVADGSCSRVAEQSAALNELATVMRRGFLVLKGDAALRRLYARVVRELPGTRLGDAGVRALGEEFKCEWLWIRKKSNGANSWPPSGSCTARWRRLIFDCSTNCVCGGTSVPSAMRGDWRFCFRAANGPPSRSRPG